MKEFVNPFDYAKEINHALEKGILLTTKADDKVNTMTIGWGMLGIEWGKPVFLALVRQSRHTKALLDHAEAVTNRYRAQLAAGNHPCKLIFVTPDYYEERPKGCMNGWGSIFLTITPDGTALPCHSARQLPISFPNVKERSLAHIWYDSFGFNHFRGDDWMQEPCRSCPEKHLDFGGCRCQAYLLTGDAAQADPVCSKSPHHHKILAARAEAEQPQLAVEELTFRNERNSRIICRS